MSAANRNIVLHVGGSVRTSLPHIWSFGVNSCHAGLWLRDDLPRHFKRLRDELGMRFVRCHGLFNDSLGVVAADGSFHFEKPLAVMERILRNGQKPFLELSDMPGVLARGPESVCRYRFRSAPPTDWKRWTALITAFLTALQERFGAEELRQWYFEVWNEPDIPFWTGSREEYFKLYDLARAAIKRIDPALRVGGPATSKCAWIPEFLEHVRTPSPDDPAPGPRCDFVTTHAYPSDLAFLNGAVGAVELQSADILPRLFGEVRETMDRMLGKGIPLFIGEWNSSAGPLAFNHDECANAAFIVKTMAELRTVCHGSLYWNGSDIYEEQGFHHAPFHGGYGLLTVNGIPKSSWHAFRFLHLLDGEEFSVNLCPASPNIGAIAVRSAENLRILLWNYANPETPGESAEIVLPEINGEGICEQIVPNHGSAFEYWRASGEPEFADRRLLAALEKAATPRISKVFTAGIIRLSPGEIALVTLPAAQVSANARITKIR